MCVCVSKKDRETGGGGSKMRSYFKQQCNKNH